ncbi:hypothetical protein ACXJJ3_32480 [Kribbella sp. WER1]
MIDEKTLQERLADAATAQDGLLPRAPAEDLAAGRRRLRVRQALTGVSATVAVVAVGVAGFSWLPRTGSQVAGREQTSTPPTTPPTEAQRAEMLRRAQVFEAHRPAGELTTARFLNLVRTSAVENGIKDPEHVVGRFAPGGATVELTNYGTARTGACSELLHMPSCTSVELADSGRGDYAEGRNGTKYVRTVRYVRPVGSEIVIRVTYPTQPSVTTEPTRAVVLGLAADPLFSSPAR